jgi:hypothetical protein
VNARRRGEVAVRRTPKLLLGLALMALSVWGVAYAGRATWAYRLYHEAKYGQARANPQRILFLCERAWRQYPWSYHLCAFAAETADGLGADLARVWCERGLKLNPYRIQLRVLKTRRLARESLPAAVAYWEQHVQWQFWDHWNHAALVELYAGVGAYERALAELEWVKGSPYYAVARERLLGTWRWDRRTTAASAGTPPTPLPR